MPFILDDIQKEAAELLRKNSHYCLFWDVGVGKTFALLSRLSDFTNKKILILSPAVVNYDMWQEQLEKDYFGVFAKNDVEIRSYEWLAHCEYKMVNGKRKKVKENYKALRHPEYDVLVCDEAHRMSTSGRKSNSSRYVSKLAKKAHYVYALTGTPARNGYEDLYYLFKNLNFNIWSQYSSYEEWLRYYFIGYNLKLPTATVFKPTKIKPYMEETFLNEVNAHSLFASKTRKYEVTTVRFPVVPIITKEYKNALDGILTDINGDDFTTNKLVGLSKAYMILNGFEYKMNLDGVNETIEYFDNPKIKKLGSVLDIYMQKHRVVIVTYNYKQDYRSLCELLDLKGIDYVSSLDEANEKTGKFVYLLQLKKGIGINLQHLSSVIIFYTYNFSFVDFDQTIGRIDRRGQENDVELVFLYFPNTIETRVILKALMTKQRIDHVLKGKNTLTELKKEVESYEHPSTNWQ